MPFPDPSPGLVIRYSYLWRNEFRRGQEEGVKDRPCAVILVTKETDGRQVVTVLPITHTPPSDPDLSIEIPAATKVRLQLDDARSWIVLSEINRFTWPGPDLRPLRAGDGGSVAYGFLPHSLMGKVLADFLALRRARRINVVPRSE